jgi:hypothetical protein
LAGLPFAAGCDETSSDSSAVAAVRVDPCEPAVLALDPEATADQKAGVRAGIELWNRGISARLSVSDQSQSPDAGAAAPSSSPTTLPLHFRRAAAPSHGYFDPPTGQILINEALTAHELTVTIAHEVGHAFGLAHVTGRPSVMTPGNLKVEPNEGDFAELVAMWGACPPVVEPPPP